MTYDDESYKNDGGHPSWGTGRVADRIAKSKDTHVNPGCDVTVDPRPPIDDSFRERKRHPLDPKEYICDDDDLGCLHDYITAAILGNDISELPRLWNQQIGVIKSRPYNDDADLKTLKKILEEIEAGLIAYEDEHKSHMAHDDCNGIYIPINVVRRLIAVRKPKEAEQRAGERG